MQSIHMQNGIFYLLISVVSLFLEGHPEMGLEDSQVLWVASQQSLVYHTWTAKTKQNRDILSNTISF